MGKKLAVVCAVLAVTYLILSSMISVHDIEDPVGPRMYPLMLGGGMLVIALMLWIEARGAAPVSEPRTSSDPDLTRRQRRGVLGASAGALVYALTMETIGYLVATFVLMLGLLTVFNRDKHLLNVAIAAGTSAVLYYGLKKFLGVPLPAGLFGFLG